MFIKGFRFGMLLQIAIGPICLLVLQIAMTSVSGAMIAVMAVTLVDGVYILGAILGLGAVIERSKRAKNMMKYFGAIVLIVFGASMILEVFNISLIPSLDFTNYGSSKNIFLNVMLVTLSNPLTMVFWAGVFSNKIIEEDMKWLDMYLFGGGAVLSTFLFLSLVVLLGNQIQVLVSQQILSALNLLVGTLLIFFGGKSFL